MKILKYKKMSGDKYKISLDNNTDIILYEDVILKFELLLTKNIDDSILGDALKYNQECDVYNVALNCLKRGQKCINDLRLFLLKKEYPSDLVEKVIDKLIFQGYLNDNFFVNCYVNYYLNNSNKGPFKIERELLDKKIDSTLIDSALELFTNDIQKEKISKIIEKGIKSNHSRGGVVLKQKIYNDLKMLGYDISIINSVISNYSFDNNELLKKEYDKLYKKYSRKYSGDELKKIINLKMYQKGFKCNDELFY